MKTSYLVWALAGIGAVGAGIAAALRTERKAIENQSTVLVGDSLGVGLGKAFQSLGLPLRSIAMKGTTVDYWTRGRTELQAVLATKPGSVFISLGANDAYGETPTNAGAATTILLGLITGNGAQVFWIGPPKMPTLYGGHALNQAVIDAIRQVVEITPGAIWIDNSVVNIPRQSDQLHPTEEGYTAWAKLLIDELGMFFVSPGPGTTTSLSGDAESDEPSSIPPPPSLLKMPSGWARMPSATRSMMVFALSVLAQRRPMGDLVEGTVDGRRVGAWTEWHWDNHVDHTWKWHRGISLLVPVT